MRALLLSGLLASSGVHAATLIWTGDFEEGAASISGASSSDFDKKVEMAGVAADFDVRTALSNCGAPRQGIYAGRARILTGGANLKVRAEVKAHQPGVVQFMWDGPEYWLGISLCLSEYPVGSDINTLYQIHAPNEESGSNCDFAGNAFTIADEYSQGFVSVIDNPGGQTSGNGAFSRTKKVYTFDWRSRIGIWQDFVVKIKLSTKGDGYYTLWHNGRQVASESGLVNVNWKDSCGNPIPKKYHNGPHTGFYGGPNNAGPKTIFIDEARVASGSDGYSLVAPRGGVAPNPEPVKKPGPPKLDRVE